jgi:hypothetical protein
MWTQTSQGFVCGYDAYPDDILHFTGQRYAQTSICISHALLKVAKTVSWEGLCSLPPTVYGFIKR